MKQVFPTVRPRRLGTRGHSRYCYAAMRKATKLDPPMLPDLTMGGGGGGGGSGALAGGELLTNGLSTSELTYSPSSNSNYAEQETWPTIQNWAQRLLHVKFASAKELADHIVKFNLLNEGAGEGHESRDTPAGSASKDSTKKIKDKRKTAASSSPDKSNSSPTKKRRKRRKKDEAVNGAGSGGGGTSHVDDADSDSTSSTAIRVKREVDSANDEDQIIDLKLPSNHSGRSDGEHSNQKMPVKLMLNDVPLDVSATATDSDELQIENIYCKKVRQAQQAKGLWFQQQQQQQTSQQQSSAGHSSVIVTPHTFSQPEIPSPSMLNQIRQQILADRESMLPKNLNKRGDGGDDSIPNDFASILPRERVISLCALDKDALDDYLPLAGDNSQEAEIMQYFDENSENGQSTGGTEDSSPKIDEGQATQGIVQIADGQSEAYPMFGGGDQRNMALNSSAVKHNTQNDNSEGEEKLSQLRQMLHMNFQQQSPTLRSSQSAAVSSTPPYPGPASASLTLLSQRHNSNSMGYSSTVVGMDLTQEPTTGSGGMGGTRGGPVSLKKRRLPPNEEIEDAVAVQRRFVPIATPPHTQMSTTVVDYTKLSPGNSGRPVEFLSPKMAAALKHQQQQQQMEMQMQTPRASPGATPLPLNNHQLESDRKTAFTRSKFNHPSPSADKISYGVVSGQQQQQQVQPPHDGTYGGEMKALNMSTFGESRSQSVPLNYRQSPVQVTSSNDGASWSSSYQNTNNANSSACSSVAPTPIPPDYNDFTEMMNIWENDATTSIPQRQEQSFSKDKNNNNNSNINNNQSTDDFMEEMKSYATGASNTIMSRSVPSTPVPGGVPYYPKAYCNGGPGVFQNYGQQQQQQQLGRCYDASKSVPTTPIVSSQFRYSPVPEVMNRRDILINGNMNLEKALATASSSNFGYGDGVGDVGVGANDGDMDEGPGRESARRRIEKIEQDRKGGNGGGGGGGGEGADESLVKEMSPLEEEMGYDPMMDTDLMNQFKNEF